MGINTLLAKTKWNHGQPASLSVPAATCPKRRVGGAVNGAALSHLQPRKGDHLSGPSPFLRSRPPFTPNGNETLASPSAASCQRPTEVAQTHLARASGTKKFSGLHRRNKMYLSYFREIVSEDLAPSVEELPPR